MIIIVIIIIIIIIIIIDIYKTSEYCFFNESDKIQHKYMHVSDMRLLGTFLLPNHQSLCVGCYTSA